MAPRQVELSPRQPVVRTQEPTSNIFEGRVPDSYGSRRPSRFSFSAVGSYFRNRGRPSLTRPTPIPRSGPVLPSPADSRRASISPSEASYDALPLYSRPPSYPQGSSESSAPVALSSSGGSVIIEETEGPSQTPAPLFAIPNSGYTSGPNTDGLRLLELEDENRTSETVPSFRPTLGYRMGTTSEAANISGGQPLLPSANDTDEREGGSNTLAASEHETSTTTPLLDNVDAPKTRNMKSGDEFRHVISELLSPILVRAKVHHNHLIHCTNRLLLMRTISLVLQLLTGVLVIAIAPPVVDLSSSQTRGFRFLGRIAMSTLGGINIFLTGFMIWNWGCGDTYLGPVKISSRTSHQLTRSLILQLFVGILIIALSDTCSPSSTALAGVLRRITICALGGTQVILAGSLLWIWSSGEPYSGLLRARELDKFIRECEYTIIDSGHESVIADSYSSFNENSTVNSRHAELLTKVDALRNEYDLLTKQENTFHMHGSKMGKTNFIFQRPLDNSSS